MSAPRFTVVIPAFNTEATIGAAIRSVLAQSVSDFELIIVDDGSTDATAERAAAHSDPRLRLLRQENAGPAVARNAAIEAGSAPLVSFLDSDDLWLPCYLETMAAALERDPAAGLVYTDAWVLDEATRRIRRRTAMAPRGAEARAPRDPEAFLALLVRRNFISSAATVRRTVLDEVGLFDPATVPAEDYGLWLRIAAAGHVCVRVAGNLVVYRDRPGSISADDLAVRTAASRALGAIAENPAVHAPIRAQAAARIAAIEASLAAEPPDSVARRTRALLRRRLPWPLLWRIRPPELVARAFPDLDAL
ncbi:MAG TPA: glycosyltransferase family A protein [Gaiellaceae bacterium]